MTHSHFRSLSDASSVNKSALSEVFPMEYRSQEMAYEKIGEGEGVLEDYVIKRMLEI